MSLASERPWLAIDVKTNEEERIGGQTIMDDSLCRFYNPAGGRKFGKRAKRIIENETIAIKGFYGCLYPGCPVRARNQLDVHHIFPRSDEEMAGGGSGDPGNGIVLCKNHHAWADRCWILPTELH